LDSMPARRQLFPYDSKQRRIGFQRGEQRIGDGAHHVSSAQTNLVGDRRGDALGNLVRPPIDDGGNELLLVCEVLIQGSRTDARAVRGPVGRKGVIPVGHKYDASGLDETFNHLTRSGLLRLLSHTRIVCEYKLAS